jgi:hypothetical protein
MKLTKENTNFLQQLQQISRGYWESSILFAGVKSGVFNILSSGLKSAGNISKTLKTDERATEILLNALAALRFVIKRGNRYRNQPLTSTYLVDGKKDYRGNTLLYSLDMWKAWGTLSQVLYSGIPATDLAKKLGTDRERVEHFICAMDEHAQEFIEGDFLKVDFGEGYDLVLMSQIFHSNSPEECVLLVKKGYRTLRKGGRLVVHDFILNEDKVSPPSAAIFAVNMLVNTPKGRTYTAGEITSWMEGANFQDIRCYDVTAASRAMVGRK